MKNNCLIIYHSKDLDGLVSGSLLKNYYEGAVDNLKMIPYNYETENIDFIDLQVEYIDFYNLIIFVDVTPTKDWLEKYKEIVISKYDNIEMSKKLIFIDHHKQKIDELFEVIKNDNRISSNFYSNHVELNVDNKNLNAKIQNYVNDKNFERYIHNLNAIGTLNIEFIISRKSESNLMMSATMLAYIYLINLDKNNTEFYEKIFQFIFYISEYDVWNFNEENYDILIKELVIYFHYGLFSDIENDLKQENYDYILSYLCNHIFHNVNKWLDKGEIIYREKIEIMKLKRNYHLFNDNFIIIYGDYPEYVLQEFLKIKFANYVIDGLIFIGFKYDENKIVLSIRQCHNKNFNCIKFVKYLTNDNGGGHFAASGGSINYNEYKYLFQKICNY